jgi:tetrahydromethanopterin S-methyltransferase subunit F
MLRRIGSNDDESTKVIGLAIGVLLALAALAGLGLVVRGLF